MTEKTRDQLRTFAEAHRSAFERDLKTLVEIASISASPAHKNDMRRCAEAAKAILESAGAKAEILETPGQPLVYGRFDVDPSAPTVTVYNHMDVQPANEPEWRTDPFKFVIENGCYRGRGTTDDKGPALSALYGAKAAREANTPVNIHFLWELEEEIGSPNFRAGIEKYKSKLKTNSVVVSDTIWLTRGNLRHPRDSVDCKPSASHWRRRHMISTAGSWVVLHAIRSLSYVRWSRKWATASPAK